MNFFVCVCSFVQRAGNTNAFQLACAGGHVETAKWLRDKYGFDPNLRTKVPLTDSPPLASCGAVRMRRWHAGRHDGVHLRVLPRPHGDGAVVVH